MKRIVSLMIMLALCLSVLCPTAAFATEYMPSIGYKDGPDIEDAEMNGEDVTDCLIVTTIPEARDKTTDIFQEDRDLLIDVYEQIVDGSMELPLDDNYVVRDLVDVSWKKEDCVDPDHGHKEWLQEEDTTVEVTFDLGVGANVEVVVLVYVDGEWVEAVSVVNNGDGTVTVVFEEICPVAFCVEKSYAPPQTGDEMARDLMLYVVLALASAAGLVALLALRRKNQ